MVIAVTVLLVATLIAVPWCGFVLVRRTLRAAGPVRQGQPGRPVPFGSLPNLGPVGELGPLAERDHRRSDGLTAGPFRAVAPLASLSNKCLADNSFGARKLSYLDAILVYI